VRTACLRERTSCTGKGGLLSVRDKLNRVVYDPNTPANGFTIDGTVCSYFSESGADDCPFRMDLRWEPLCTGGCVNPETATITARLLFRPGPEFTVPFDESLYGFSFSREAAPTDPRSCLQLLASGQDKDGSYIIRPDPKSPAFSVYCDQTNDGGGWALVLNAAKADVAELVIDRSLTPLSQGRLTNDQVNAILNASEKQNENNIRLNLPEIDGGFVFAASTNGSVEVAGYHAAVPSGECRKVEEATSFATKTQAPLLSIEFKGNGTFGFSDLTDARKGYLGFYLCMGSSLDGNACGQGCGRKWTGSLVRQKGSIWIR